MHAYVHLAMLRILNPDCTCSMYTNVHNVRKHVRIFILVLYVCISTYVYVGLKHQFPNTEHEKLHVTLDYIRQVANAKVVSTLHGTRTIKFGFVDDSTLFNKSKAYHSSKLSVFISPFQYVKHIKPSEVEKEFHYISEHVVELLSHCHPELLIKWCENLMMGESSSLPSWCENLMIGETSSLLRWYETHKIKLLPPYSVHKLRKLRTSSAILKMMSIFWSWSNHSVLTCLAEFSEIAAALLQDFDSRLYLNSSITKYPISPPLPSMIPHNNNNSTILTVKCNRKLQVTLQLVYDIQSMMIEKCEITEHALRLLAVQSSPLELQLIISKYIVTLINVNVRKHREYFATKGITEILVHPNVKHCIHGDPKLFSLEMVIS